MPYKDPKMQKRRQLEIQRNVPGFLVAKWRFMRLRTEGRCCQAPKYFKGKEVMPREDFIEWSRNHPVFILLHLQWEQSNYNPLLTPVPDRLNSKFGYIAGNIEWVTKQENDRRARQKMKENRIAKINVRAAKAARSHTHH